MKGDFLMGFMGEERHIFPGGNTPKGFFSYYRYILGQREANRIFCLKGGPGTGKSSFLRKIGEEFCKEGESVDFMHCSSDPESLDGVVLRERKIALIDATSPHIVDPISPGAVDEIIHLGAFWDEEGIRKNKMSIMEAGEHISGWYGRAYHYLAAAENVFDNLCGVYDEAIESAEIYRMAAELVGRELSHKEICLHPGTVKKYFASAITPKGLVHYLPGIASGCRKIYLISAPIGASAERILNIFAEGAVYRGFTVEEYFCPMKPERRMEHLVVPELSIAFLTANEFHDVEAWQLPDDAEEIEMLDIGELASPRVLAERAKILQDSRQIFDLLIQRTVECLESAKQKHDLLESYYIPNMDFKKIDALRDEIIAKIRLREV